MLESTPSEGGLPAMPSMDGLTIPDVKLPELDADAAAAQAAAAADAAAAAASAAAAQAAAQASAQFDALVGGAGAAAADTLQAASAALQSGVDSLADLLEIGGISTEGQEIVLGIYAITLIALFQALRAVLPTVLTSVKNYILIPAAAFAGIAVLGNGLAAWESLPPALQPLVIYGSAGLVVVVLAAVAVTKVKQAVDDTTTSIKTSVDSAVGGVTDRVSDAFSPVIEAKQSVTDTVSATRSPSLERSKIRNRRSPAVWTRRRRP